MKTHLKWSFVISQDMYMSFDEVIKVLICVFEDFADNEPMNLVELDPCFFERIEFGL